MANAVEQLRAKLKAKRQAYQQSTISRKLKKQMDTNEPISKLLPKQVIKIQKKLLQTAEFSDDSPNARHSILKQSKALAEHLVGDSQRDVEERNGLSNGYINSLLTKKFGDRQQLNELLEDVLLENALVAGAIFQDKAPEMSGRDAAIATGVFTQRLLEVQKAKQPDQGVLPITVLLRLEETLDRVRQVRHGLVLNATTGEVINEEPVSENG